MDLLKLLWRTAFSEDEKAILLILDGDPMSAPTISKRLHESSDGPSSRLKTLLANLCERGVLELTREGYRITDPRLLEVASREHVPSEVRPPG